MTRQEYCLLTAKLAEHQRCRRLAEWRAHYLAPGDLEIFQVGESTATDDRYELHVQSPEKRLRKASLRPPGMAGVQKTQGPYFRHKNNYFSFSCAAATA